MVEETQKIQRAGWWCSSAAGGVESSSCRCFASATQTIGQEGLPPRLHSSATELSAGTEAGHVTGCAAGGGAPGVEGLLSPR